MASNAAALTFAIRAVNESSKVLGDVRGDIEKTGKTAEEHSGKLGKFGGALGDIAKTASGVVGGIGLASLPGMLLDFGKAAAADAQATDRLKQSLRNLGGDFDSNLAKVNDAIDAGQKLAFTDDDIRDGFQFLASATGDTDEALKRLAAAQDLARGANIPLATATKMLGKINEDNVEVFKKLGITLGDNATEADALAAVQAKFGGQADAYAKSTAGQFEVAQIRMAELQEALGAKLLPAMVAFITFINNDVIPALEDFSQWFDEEAMPKIEEFIAFVREHWDEISAIVVPVLKEVENEVRLTFEIITGIIKVFNDLLHGDFSAAWTDAKELVNNVVSGMQHSIENLLALLQGLTGPFIEAGKNIGQGILDGIVGIVSAGGQLITDAIFAAKDAMLGLIGNAADWLVDIGWDIVRGIANGIRNAIPSILGGALDALANAVPDGVKKVLKIISPSRVMADEVGEPIVQGVAKGITEHADVVDSVLAVLASGWVLKSRQVAQNTVAAATGALGAGRPPSDFPLIDQYDRNHQYIGPDVPHYETNPGVPGGYEFIGQRGAPIPSQYYQSRDQGWIQHPDAGMIWVDGGYSSFPASWRRGQDRNVPPQYAVPTMPTPHGTPAGGAGLVRRGAGMAPGPGDLILPPGSHGPSSGWWELNPLLASAWEHFGRFARGGIVPGPIGAGDIVPALLSPGERVIPVGGGGGIVIHQHFQIDAVDAGSIRRIMPKLARELDQHTRRLYGST